MIYVAKGLCSIVLFVYVNVFVMSVTGNTLGKIGGGLGDISCVSERDCAANAYCIDNRYCTCKDGFVQDSATQSCIPQAKKINDPCTIDIQCTSSFGTHATCHKEVLSQTGKCVCQRTAHFQDGLCYQSVHLGGPCKVSDNCVSTSNVATYCAYSVCVCAAGYHASDDHLDCLPDVDLDEVCRRDEDCVAENSYCGDGVCTCQYGYLTSSNGTTCLLAARSLRAPCVEDAQCLRHLPHTLCDLQDNTCKCAPFSHELDASCWMSSRLDGACVHPNQCMTPSHNRSLVTCAQGRCSCSFGHVRSNQDCVIGRDASQQKSSSSQLQECSLFILLSSTIFLRFLVTSLGLR